MIAVFLQELRLLLFRYQRVGTLESKLQMEVRNGAQEYEVLGIILSTARKVW